MTFSEPPEDYSEEIAACRAEMKPLCLTWKSRRVKNWIFARTGHTDPHYLSREDFKALTEAIAKIKTSEFHEAYSHLTDLMGQVEVSFDSPVICAWMRREGVLDDGLTISLIGKLVNALKLIKEKPA